jgi:hypothetical protein
MRIAAAAAVRAARAFTSAALFVCLGAAATAAPWSGVRSVEVADPQYQMTAFTLAVPIGWKFAGAVVRDSGCHGKGASLKSTSQSPDGQTALYYMPGFRWSWTTNVFMREAMEKAHCPDIDIDNAASFLVNIAVPNLQPRATIVSVQPLEAAGQASLAAQLQQQRQSNAAAAARYGVTPQQLSLTGARVRIRFIANGKPMEEQLLSVVDCTEAQMPALYAQPAYSRRGCSARNISIVRAPQGHLDELLGSAELASLNKATHPNMQWVERMTRDEQAAFNQWQADNNKTFQGILRQGQANHDALLAQGRQFQQQEQQKFQQAQAQDQARQHAIDSAAHGQVLDSLGRQEFRNPANGQIIQASSYYDHQWLSSDGKTLIQTNDTLDPNGVVYPVSQSWTELVPK